MADTKQPEHVKSIKKPFNKKRWREERYSTKYKVQQWENRRKVKLQRQLKKQLSYNYKKEGVSENISSSRSGRENSRPSRLHVAQLEYERKRESECQAIEEARRIKEEKKKKIKENQVKKAERLRKLSQKTRKGQPVMRGRMELLQQKIEKMIATNKL